MFVQGEMEAKATGGKRAWGLAGGESGAVPSALLQGLKMQNESAFLLPTPHLLRLYYLLSFMLFCLVYACRQIVWAGGAPRPESECTKQIPPLDPPLLCACCCRAAAQELKNSFICTD